MYKLEYLPLARQDMVNIVRYIGVDLRNPIAAKQLAEALIEAGDGIPRFPYANPAYIPIRPLTHEYRKLQVKNYYMLYWVDEEKKLITVARVTHVKQDQERLLE